jgi:hypothetical protein
MVKRRQRKALERIDNPRRNPYIPAPLPRAAEQDRLDRVPGGGPVKAILLWSNARWLGLLA